MIPREQLEQWKALADAATPGPWFVQETPGSYSYLAHWVDHNGEKLRSEVDSDSDRAFCAAARSAVPALVAEVEEKAKEIERLRERERAARIEAVEEFRKKALIECHDTDDQYAANRIWRRIAALPALPEGA